MPLQGNRQDGDSAVCIATSGNIDAVHIHLYVVSRFWPRRKGGNFRNSVNVIFVKNAL